MKKKLIEVALPLEAINAACKADKDRKTGSIRNLHKWFAPMPSPAWRAILFAALVDDPGDERERSRLFGLIEKLLGPGGHGAEAALLEAREQILRSVGSPPIVVDPFCGGGSTLVEAQRLGLLSIGVDLNPIPVLISRTLTEMPPRLAEMVPPIISDGSRLPLGGDSLDQFKQHVLGYARRVYQSAREALGPSYPAGPNGDPVIAYRWARTVSSPDPSAAGARTPLVADWWLSKRKGDLAWIRAIPNRQSGTVAFEVVSRGEPDRPASAGSHAYCLFSGAPVPFDYLHQEGLRGRMGLSLMALVTYGAKGRAFHGPTSEEERAAAASVAPEKPEVDLPEGGLGFRVQAYGIRQWWQLFTGRQNLALGTFADLVAQVPAWAQADGADSNYAAAIASVLGLCLGKLAQFNSTLALWKIDSRNGSGKAESAFGRNDIPMTWDFTEVNPIGGSVGDWLQVVKTALRAFDQIDSRGPAARVYQGDASRIDSFVSGDALIATDPPYFHYIGYGDLSDYFYVWIRRALRNTDPDLFSTVRTPKLGELIADPSRHQGDAQAAKDYFIRGFTSTFTTLRRLCRPDLPLLFVYAFKQQETADGEQRSTGWDAFLQAVLNAGLGICGTWPIRGTGSTRQRSQSSNTLATYVLLVCRPRQEGASLGTRREFHAQLRTELRTALRTLRSAAIAATDLAQAAIGPGMAVFSRFSRVVEADGSTMTVRAALALINEVLDEVQTEQEGEFDPGTRWALAWFEQYGFDEGPFGVAEALSKAKNTSVGGLEETRILVSKGGRVRLLRRGDLDEDWDPKAVSRLTLWEATQHLVRRHEMRGEEAAAEFLRDIGGGLGDAAKGLAYRLYQICDRKGWAQEALSYNALVVAWPEVSRLAQVAPGELASTEELFP